MTQENAMISRRAWLNHDPSGFNARYSADPSLDAENTFLSFNVPAFEALFDRSHYEQLDASMYSRDERDFPFGAASQADHFGLHHSLAGSHGSTSSLGPESHNQTGLQRHPTQGTPGSIALAPHAIEAHATYNRVPENNLPHHEYYGSANRQTVQPSSLDRSDITAQPSTVIPWQSIEAAFTSPDFQPLYFDGIVPTTVAHYSQISTQESVQCSQPQADNYIYPPPNSIFLGTAEEMCDAPVPMQPLEAQTLPYLPPTPEPARRDSGTQQGASRTRTNHNQNSRNSGVKAAAKPRKISKRTGPLSDQQRRKAATIRKIGRCVRCMMYKLGCDPNDPCAKCEEVRGTTRLFHSLCCRVDLKSLTLARQSNGRFGQEKVKFKPYRWVQPRADPVLMRVKWTLSWHQEAKCRILDVGYKEYAENVGESGIDSKSYLWHVNGTPKKVSLPPYALVDTEDLLRKIEDLITSNKGELETQIYNNVAQDRLTKLVYEEALRYRRIHSSSLINKAFLVHCGAVLSQGWGSVLDSYSPTGEDRVDYRSMGTSVYPAYNRQNDRPLPQAIGHQFDVAILIHTNKWAMEFLKELKPKIFNTPAQGKPWYEIFLGLFIVLSNLVYVYEGAIAYQRAKQRTVLSGQVNNVVNSQIEKYDHTAKILIYHFRCVLRGYMPFELAKSNAIELQRRAGIDDAAIEFLQSIAYAIDSPEEKISNPRFFNHKWLWDLFDQTDN